MKKMLTVICFILLFTLVVLTAFPPHKLYTIQARVYLVDFQEDFSVFEDENGNMWGLYGTEVPEKGTHVILTIDSNNTESIYDDSIVQYKKY